MPTVPATADTAPVRWMDTWNPTIAVSGSTGVAEWSARFRSIAGDVPVELNGVFMLEFADSGQVSSLREWWHVR